jgi:tetratricopeptide (TPR) repeat protein
MSRQEKHSYPKDSGLIHPVNAAQKFVSLFEQVVKPNEEQRAMLAAAYYTLSTQQNISLSRCKMHVNSAITLLKDIQVKARKENWNSQIAHAYFKRAELFEEKNAFQSASLDYQRAMDALEHSMNHTLNYTLNDTFGHFSVDSMDDPNPNMDNPYIDDYDRLLFAQSAISIADLIVNGQINAKDNHFSHPLFYVNKALEQLADVVKVNDDIWTTQAYAHQIAGIALSREHFEESKDAYQTAISVAFNTESLCIGPLLSDIYICLGLLFEQQHQSCPIVKNESTLLDQAMIYYGLALLFNPNEIDEEKEDNISLLEPLFEMIYRVLDPFLTPLPLRVTTDVIDALIYVYLCVIEKVLPNDALAQQLCHGDTLDTFAQHIYWLVIEVYRKSSPGMGLLEIANPNNPDYLLQWPDICDILEQGFTDNVHYLETR